MAYPSTFKDLYQSTIDKLRMDQVLDLQKSKDYVNSAYMRSCIDTEIYVDSTQTTTLPANATSVTVPASLLMINYIVPLQVDGLLLPPMQLVGIDVIAGRRAWSGGTITQTAPQMYAYQSSPNPSIEFWPTASGGEVFTFYGTRLPPLLAADGDVPIIPEPYATNCIVYGACISAAEFKQNFIMLQNYEQQHEFWIQKLRGFQNNRVGNRVQQFGIENAHRPVPSTNAIDTPYNWW
jgi:hypothetical protein